MKYFSQTLLLVAIILFAACEKIIQPKDLPQQDSRLVLNSIIYSNDTIKANISASKSILSGKDYKLIDNAICQVYENEVYLGDLQTIQKGNYSSSFIAKANTSYRFIVSANGYTTVTASTNVPNEVNYVGLERYDTLDFNYKLTTSSVSSTTVLSGTSKFRLKIIDDVNTKNYYSIRPVVIFTDNFGKTKTDIYPNIINNINSNSLDGLNTYGGASLDIDDLTLVNGNEIQLDFNVDIYQALESNTTLKSIRVYVELINLSDDYYKYILTLNKQANTGLSLFAEPVFVYNNINKGMGILAGASVKRVLVY